MAYQELQPGQTPTFGTKGQPVVQYQTQLNAQNQGKPGWTPLSVDGIFGTKTQQASNFGKTNPLIVTGTNPANQFNQDTQTLNNILAQVGNQSGIPQTNPQMPGTTTAPITGTQDLNVATYSDPYTQMLDKISATSDKATQNLIATIKASKSQRENTINQDADRLKQGLFSLGIATDKLQYTPDLVYGSITQAENQRTSQLQQLDQQEATALLEAQQARENKDFSLLKEKMAHIKEIKNQKLETLKNSFDTLNYEAKIGELKAKQVYDQLQKLPESGKLPFLQKIATEFNIPLAALTSQIGEITRARAKSVKKATSSKSKSTSTSSKNYTATNIPDDILTALKEDIEGYEGVTINDLIKAYPEVSTSYLNGLLKQLKPKS